ncbi:MAG: nucleotide exchange factor GrpE [Silvanigrellales bacterium]|nr:nucleotide exchange factor GrpE [Silvanigrellales bacterium]
MSLINRVFSLRFTSEPSDAGAGTNETRGGNGAPEEAGDGPETNHNLRDATREAARAAAGASATGADGTDEAEIGTAKERELQTKLAETTDRMLRIAAEFENTRKRWEKDRQETRAYAITEFSRDLLPVIDAFDNAMNAIEQSQGSFETEEGKRMSSITEGVRLVSKVFLDALRKHGVERIPSKGEAFNPMLHNAVARTVDASVKQETVVDEFVAGYKIADRVLRTAMVRVATPD